MAIIPTVRCRSMRKSLAFYTGVLDFERVDGDASGNVAELFRRFRERGLQTPGNPEAPEHVHEGPIDQSWGTREFYVDDPDGNTLRFTQQ